MLRKCTKTEGKQFVWELLQVRMQLIMMQKTEFMEDKSHL